VKKTVMLVAGGLEIGSGDSDVTQPASKFAQKVPQSLQPGWSAFATLDFQPAGLFSLP
jgi:hypothetical protein